MQAVHARGEVITHCEFLAHTTNPSAYNTYRFKFEGDDMNSEFIKLAVIEVFRALAHVALVVAMVGVGAYLGARLI